MLIFLLSSYIQRYVTLYVQGGNTITVIFALSFISLSSFPVFPSETRQWQIIIHLRFCPDPFLSLKDTQMTNSATAKSSLSTCIALRRRSYIKAESFSRPIMLAPKQVLQFHPKQVYLPSQTGPVTPPQSCHLSHNAAMVRLVPWRIYMWFRERWLAMRCIHPLFDWSMAANALCEGK